MSKNSTLSRRGLLAGIPASAAVTAVSVVASVAPTDDPIFAVIEEYKRTDLAVCDIQEPVDRARFRALENFRPWQEWANWHQEDPAGYEACREQAERAVPAELAARHRAAKEAYESAIDALSETAPTTVAGAAALLAFFIEDDALENGEGAWHRPILDNLHTALKRLAA